MSSFIGMHVALGAKDPTALATFYRNVLGMHVVGESSPNSKAPAGKMIFLSSRPAEENHEVAFFENGSFAHTAFKVASLAELLALYRQIKDYGLRVKMAVNHGISLAFYFDDIEGNLIEIYWATDTPTQQPIDQLIQIDLETSEEEVRSTMVRTAQQFDLSLPPETI